MRTNLAVVLALLLVNDALLVLSLEASVKPWGTVLAGAVAVAVLVVAVTAWTTEDSQPPARTDLDEALRETSADLTRLENRVEDLEDADDDSAGN